MISNDLVVASIITIGWSLICLLIIAFISVKAIRERKRNRKIVAFGTLAGAILFPIIFPHISEAVNPSLSKQFILIVSISDTLLISAMPLAVLSAICFIHSSKNRF